MTYNPRDLQKELNCLQLSSLVPYLPTMASLSFSTSTPPATPPPAGNTSDKHDMEIALGPNGRPRDEWMTSKSSKDVSRETEPFT